MLMWRCSLRTWQFPTRSAGSDGELLEDYPSRREGHTKLLLGFAGAKRPVHVVVNVHAYESNWSEPIAVVTVYEPESPEWADEKTRGKRR
jgi:hypothetical protein